MAEKTNVNVEFITYSTADVSTQYGIIFASGDYPDIIANIQGNT